MDRKSKHFKKHQKTTKPNQAIPSPRSLLTPLNSSRVYATSSKGVNQRWTCGYVSWIGNARHFWERTTNSSPLIDILRHAKSKDWTSLKQKLWKYQQIKQNISRTISRKTCCPYHPNPTLSYRSQEIRYRSWNLLLARLARALFGCHTSWVSLWLSYTHRGVLYV